jgi:hypothetical protein
MIDPHVPAQHLTSRVTWVRLYHPWQGADEPARHLHYVSTHELEVVFMLISSLVRNLARQATLSVLFQV